ncbi:MAG: ABC transporter permease [Bacilli bacterium]|nr:ABC transporter permease [Bacilli bacterium]
MIVFKTYLKILKKNLFIVILYTLFLIIFTGFNIKSDDNNLNYKDIKPDILIINEDDSVGITKHLITYLEKNTNHVSIKNDENSINDAIFYRDVSFIIYIPNNFHINYLTDDYLIKIKSTNDYEAILANLYLEKYLKVLNNYKDLFEESELLTKMDEVLDTSLEVNLTSKLNTNSLNKAVIYYNFLNYSLLATSLYIVSLILLSFNEPNIKKRIIISSMKINKLNRLLFLANSLFMMIIWIIYVLLSFGLIGKIMFTLNGLVLIINSFIFMIFTLSLAIFIANLLKSKDSINGLTNVLSLGTSFLCGAFVPISYLPNSVLKFSKLLPSYYYIKTNEIIKTLEVINLNTLKPVIINIIVLISFIILFIVLNNIISKKVKNN